MVSALCVKQVAKNSLFSSGTWGTKAGTEAKGRVVIPCLVPAPAADKIAYSQFSCLKNSAYCRAAPMAHLGTAGPTRAGRWLFRQGKLSLTAAKS